MQAATHLAGAALTLAVARGFGMEVGPFEVGAMMLGSLLPDIDTTTAGAGRYIRPVSSWLESKYGHRTVTHSLLFAVLVSLPFWLLWPGVGLALFLGIFSHLLLDTANVNGLPYLLFPVRHTFWFLPSRRSRIRYGSSQETTLAVILALSGVALWPLSADTFSTEVRRLIASPETAVVDYANWRDTNEVFAELDGFNSDTQEKVEGKYRVIEALGRRGVLVEDEAGNAYQVAENGQIVAYRVRVQKGAALAVLDSRVSVGGRLLRDVLAAVPPDARVYFTGELQLSAPVNIPPPAAGTFARIAGTDRLTLHSARPADLSPFAASYVVAGSLVARLSAGAGRSGVRSRQEAGLSFELPAEASRTEARTVTLSGLPSLAGVLVERGANVLEGQPLARYVLLADLADLDTQMTSKRRDVAEAKAQRARARASFEQQRDTLGRTLAPAQEAAQIQARLYALGAVARVDMEQAQMRAQAVDDQMTALGLNYSDTAAQARARADGLALDLQALQGKRARSAAAQVVRSPVAGKVAEVRVKDATQAGVSVDVVIISTLATAPTAPVKASSLY
ncbi:hydrolase [Deinococcus detaillensis]|uniref:Hydrolase n=1 Tax=Deinococcus detaillensis TaxID=2592048 RepID=A0A553UHF8_9DEIO|nr:metal-dependent hydrolase [Deinococcus detaillensis]TSA79649.1 hydrolase [Deinococcus detaillensis]